MTFILSHPFVVVVVEHNLKCNYDWFVWIVDCQHYTFGMTVMPSSWWCKWKWYGIVYVFHVARILNKLSHFVFAFLFIYISFLWSFCFSCVQNKHIFISFAVLWRGDKKEADIIWMRDEKTRETEHAATGASPCVSTKLISNVKWDSLITVITMTDLYRINF